MEASHEVVNYRLAKIAVFNAVGYGYDAVPSMNPRIVFDALGGTISTYEVVDGEALSVRIVIHSGISFSMNPRWLKTPIRSPGPPRLPRRQVLVRAPAAAQV